VVKNPALYSGGHAFCSGTGGRLSCFRGFPHYTRANVGITG